MRSFKPGWWRPRLSIRALMIGIAALALAFASVWVYLPWLRWRARVDRIIDKKLAKPDRRGGLFFSPTYQQYNDLTGPEYRDVLKDLARHTSPNAGLRTRRTKRTPDGGRRLSPALRGGCSPNRPHRHWHRSSSAAFCGKPWPEPRGPTTRVPRSRSA